jgi:hypothetical protein
MIRTALVLALSIAIGAPTTAQPLPAPQQTQVAAKIKPEDKIVCRFINTTGSRLSGERVCKTRAQWSSDADQARDEFENAPRRPSGDPSPQGPG